ncbi:MAG: YraN family protein [Clostridia bacterium]|nr:YraN family protein [Clostridia bacterium]
MRSDPNDKKYVGELGERLAAAFLKKRKYKIVANNVHAGRSEIDIIALKDDTLVFVEVKSRVYEDGKEYLSRPADAVNTEKSSYLIRGAVKFCRDNSSKFASYLKRIDIIEVYFTRKGEKLKAAEIKHFENAIGGKI